jgi:four helix bundle protein
MSQNSNYNLDKRTTIFGESLIKFCKTLSLDTISKPIVSQIIRSGTSIGANYMEANNASSRKDFTNKIFICKKESQETKYWLVMLETCFPKKLDEIKLLKQEAQELLMIFQKITNTLRDKLEK